MNGLRGVIVLAGVALLVLAGCGVTAQEIECCQERCEANGGVAVMVPQALPGYPVCHCENGAKFSRACEARR